MKNDSITIVIIILAGILGGYIYHANISSELSIAPPNIKTDDLAEFEDIQIDFASLNTVNISELKVFGDYPVDPVVTGKRDIFAPF